MAQKIIVIGAGIIGAFAAYQLQKAGAEVLVLDAGTASATAASFGWINASFYLDDDHFQLRTDAIAAYRDLANDIALPVRWSGCLCFENQGDAFDTQADALSALGYAFTQIDAQQFAGLVPRFEKPPARSLLFEQEAVAESGELARALLDAAIQMGARVAHGVFVQGFDVTRSRVTGVRTNAGVLAADHVVSAVGTATEQLLQDIDVALPMLTRPAVVVRTKPVAPLMSHVLVTEIGEVRQCADGTLLMPAAFSHQGDQSEKLLDAIDRVADDAIARLQALFPEIPLAWSQATLAHRPVPQDQRPAVGPVAEGLYVACMHSGVTLGALMGEQIATEVLNGPSNETAKRLAPYRPDRFQT